MAHRTRRELDGRFTAVLTRQVAMPQPKFILLIEPDDDSRVTHTDASTPSPLTCPVASSYAGADIDDR